jgi:hypothetical protein
VATVSGLGDRDTTCAIVGGVVVMRKGVRGVPKEWLHLPGADSSPHGPRTTECCHSLTILGRRRSDAQLQIDLAGIYQNVCLA